MLIARLRGEIEENGLDGILVDVGGVGYPVLVSTGTRSVLPFGVGHATLLIETQIREDAVIYYGFVQREERDWFRLLINVQGVGGKVALSILSVFTPDRLAQAILAQDKAMLSRADGVGPKLAARLVTELKDKAAAWGLSLASRGTAVAEMVPAVAAANAAGSGPFSVASGAVSEAASGIEDAVSALTNLGYRRVDALSAVSVAARKLGDGADAATLIRVGLQEISA